MNNNLTREQINKLKKEFEPLGLQFDKSSLKAISSKEYISSIFSHITIPEIKEKISNFQKIDLKNISDKDLDTAIADVMNIEIDGQKMQVFLPQSYTYPIGTRFYRTRIVDPLDLDQFSTIEAYWNPPKEFIIKPGRLNKAHESLLYTSLNSATTFSELKIEANQTFALIVYEALEPIKMNVIGLNSSISEMSENDNRKFKLYNNFLREEFTKEVHPGLEHRYKVSEYIAKFYFDLPPRAVQDAWLYPSVASAGEYNVCFRPEIAKEVLKFVGVIFGIMLSPREKKIFQCLSIGFLDSENNMAFSKYNPISMKKFFPEFLLKSNNEVN